MGAAWLAATADSRSCRESRFAIWLSFGLIEAHIRSGDFGTIGCVTCVAEGELNTRHAADLLLSLEV